MRPLFALAFAASVAGPAGAEESVLIGDVPLPTGIEITEAEDASFFGVWTGRWDSWRNHILVVEGRDEDGLINVVYSVGRDWRGRGNWFRTKARIEDATLVFEDERFPARYAISDTGRLRGIYPTKEHFAVLQRQELSDILATPTDAWFELGLRETLVTDLREDGQAISLAVAIYVPEGDGPFPLALVHHGSTGSGTNPADFDWFFTNDWFADVLNAHGWIAAFPQRRGRGGSDGLYDEGFSEDRTKGYSPQSRLSLPGAERALTDANAALAALQQRHDVRDGPVLLSGVSRGGVVALMQAGDQPGIAAGVINFVGGWISEPAGDPEINPTLFRRIEGYDGVVLSIYGEDDPYYSIEHSRSNLSHVQDMGAESELHVISIPGFNMGHSAMWRPSLWEDVVSGYLQRINSRP